MNEQSGNQLKSKKFKQTKELVRLARNSGWKQIDIANACRVHQSQVSDWSKGKSVAREDQLGKLLDEFGHKLRRKTFKVYWNFEQTSNDNEWKFFRIEGRIIMDHTFYDLRCSGKTGKMVKNIPRRRLIVHDQGNGNYLLLLQSRLGIKGSDDLVECSVPDAKWITEIVTPEPMKKNQLIDFIDTERDRLLCDFRSDAATLPYLVRRALLYAGESVDDVIDFSA